MVYSSSDEAVSLLSELIQNECVNPPGNELKSVRTVQRVLQEHSIESRVFESAQVGET